MAESHVPPPMRSHETYTAGPPELREVLEQATADAEPGLERGALVGRYVVIERVGVGGMGIVYAAYDPELDRKLAVKLLRSTAAGSLSSAGSSRMMREAQAMARLSHPNVITVHDVGTTGDQIYIAMEFVEGKTLKAWLRSEPAPSRDEIVDVFLRAGHGIAAAHAAELVHRDFKPDNVMVGTDGRVRVMDFGLARRPARAEVVTAEHEVKPDSSDLRSDSFDVELTRPGAMIGTPAYMAPEQHLGLNADARCDQFGFCVALYHALYGQAPFGGKKVRELALEVTQGNLRDPPAGTTVPTWMHKVLVRGLEIDPDDRWPSMDALLAELDRDPPARRRGWLWGGGFVGIGAAVAGALYAEQASGEARCTDPAIHLAGAWDAARSARVQAAVLGTGLSYAGDTWTRLEAGLDSYANRFMSVHAGACLATDGVLAELRVSQSRCLADRKAELTAVVGVLEGADAKVVEKAVEVIGDLGWPERCAELEYLSAQVKPPDDPEVSRQVKTLRAQLSRALALQNAGKFREGMRVAQETLASARALDYTPLVTETLTRVANLHDELGAYDESAEAYAEAYYLAGTVGHDEVAAEAATSLVRVLGDHSARYEQAEVWAQSAAMMIGRAGKQGQGIEARLLGSIGAVLRAQGRYDEALEHVGRGLAMREAEYGPDHSMTATVLNNLGGILYTAGRHEEALEQLSRALEIHEQTLGPQHPQVATSYNNLGLVLDILGRREEALRHQRHALELREQAFGPDHPSVAGSLHNIGLVLDTERRKDEALAHHLRAFRIFERRLPSDHPNLAKSLANVGIALTAKGRIEEALHHHERSLAIHEAALGPDHPDVAASLNHVGDAFHDQGRFDESLDQFRRSLTITEAALGPDNLAVPVALMGMGRALFALERTRESTVAFERALAIREATAGDPTVLAATQIALAHALWRAGEPGRARSLAQQARDGYAAAGEHFADIVAEIEQIVAEHGG